MAIKCTHATYRVTFVLLSGVRNCCQEMALMITFTYTISAVCHLQSVVDNWLNEHKRYIAFQIL